MIFLPKFVDTKTIIVNLLKEDKKNYLSIDRLQQLIQFIYKELSKQSKLDEYQISFDVNFNALRRTVQYNNTIFDLDIDGETIYLRENQCVNDLAEKFETDVTIVDIIKRFIEFNAA